MEQKNHDRPTGTEKTRVYLLVDSSMIRAALEPLLAAGGIEVVGSSAEPEQALVEVSRSGAHVLLVDLRKPDSDGFAWGIRLRQALKSTPVLVVRENPAPEQVNLALRSGVDCVLAPDEDVSEMFIAIDTLRRGKTYLSPRLVPHASARGMELPRDFARQSVHLSHLEIEVVRGLALGQLTSEIAVGCNIPEAAARDLIAAVSAKLDCRSAADFVRFAIREGFLPRED